MASSECGIVDNPHSKAFFCIIHKFRNSCLIQLQLHHFYLSTKKWGYEVRRQSNHKIMFSFSQLTTMEVSHQHILSYSLCKKLAFSRKPVKEYILIFVLTCRSYDTTGFISKTQSFLRGCLYSPPPISSLHTQVTDFLDKRCSNLSSTCD